MFEYQRKIFLSDTDLTGSIYFTQLLKWAEEGFELYIDEKHGSLASFFKETGSLLPIVQAHCSISQRLEVGDSLEIALQLGKMGRSSFMIRGAIKRLGELVATTEITHVCVNAATGRSSEITTEFARFLKGLE